MHRVIRYADAVVIVIMGAAGAGKTTVGRALAAELGWPFVDADDHHPPQNVDKMHAGVALTDADREPWLASLHAVVSRAIDRREHTVLACSALKERYRQALHGHRHPVRFVYLKATEAELQHRLTARPDHFFGPGLLASQLATLEEPGPGDALVVDATWPAERILAAIRQEFGV
jgi:gluconokinase